MPARVLGSRFSAAVALSLACALTAAPMPVFADDAAEKSLELARDGAGHFKEKRYIEAARAFESAYRTNPVDPRNLRYAGRAWEEVGVIDRAISLFERYLQVETNPEYRQSIVSRLDKLKAITAKERAEALAMATIKYPQGRLEEEAAQAFERLGDKASLDRAIKLYETSRLWAETPEAKAKVDANINRVRKAIDDLERKANEPDKPDPGTGLPGQPHKPAEPEGDTLGMVLYIVGGVALVAGGGLGGYGYLSYDQAIQDNDAGKFATRDAYDSATESARTMNQAGYGLAAVGVGVLGWAIVRTVMRGDPADKAAPVPAPGGKKTEGSGESTSLYLQPRFDRDGAAGFVLGGRF